MNSGMYLQYQLDDTGAWWSSIGTIAADNQNQQNVAISARQDLFKQEEALYYATADGILGVPSFNTATSSSSVPVVPHHRHHQAPFDARVLQENKTPPNILSPAVTGAHGTPLSTITNRPTAILHQKGTTTTSSANTLNGVAAATTTKNNTTIMSTPSFNKDTMTFNNINFYTAAAKVIDDSSSSSMMLIDIPHDFDVLCGRGKPIQQHLGNILLRKLVDLHMKRYIRFNREERKRLVEEILQAMKTKNIRFLKVSRTITTTTTTTTIPAASNNTNDTNHSRRMIVGSSSTKSDDKNEQCLLSSWIEIDDNDAKDKIAHCFRSRLPSFQEWIKEDDF